MNKERVKDVEDQLKKITGAYEYFSYKAMEQYSGGHKLGSAELDLASRSGAIKVLLEVAHMVES